MGRRKAGSTFVRSGEETVYAPSSGRLESSSRPQTFEDVSLEQHPFFRLIELMIICLAFFSNLGGAEAERKACYGLFLGRNQEVSSIVLLR